MSGAGKIRLRVWLEKMIDGQQIQGLVWLNDEHTKFKIPWKHHGKQDWSPDNSQIFMEWAKHTGKYNESTDTPDYPTWKTRLRCAFNKAPDITEMKEESRLDLAEPYRVYTLTDSKRSKRMSSESNSSPPRGHGCAMSQTSENQDIPFLKLELKSFDSVDHFSIEPNSTNDLLPTSVTEFEESMSREDLFQSNPNSVDQKRGFDDGVSGSPCTDGDDGSEYCSGGSFPSLFHLLGDTDKLEMKAEGQLLFTCDQLQSFESPQSLPFNDQSMPFNDQSLPFNDQSFNDRLEVTVKYCSQVVLRTTLNQGGFLRYGEPNDLTVEGVPDCIPFARISSQVVTLPDWNTSLNVDPSQRNGVSLLSVGFTKGLVLWMTDNHDIHAYRLCPCAVFYKSELETDHKPVKIRIGRQDQTRIFSYADRFEPAVREYSEGQRSRPDPVTYLLVGQKGDNLDEVLIQVSIVSRKALDDLDAADRQITYASSAHVEYLVADDGQNLADLGLMEGIQEQLQMDFQFSDDVAKKA